MKRELSLRLILYARFAITIFPTVLYLRFHFIPRSIFDIFVTLFMPGRRLMLLRFSNFDITILLLFRQKEFLIFEEKKERKSRKMQV